MLALMMLCISLFGGYAAYLEAQTTDCLDSTQVASSKELGQALAYHMSQFDETFSISYIGKSRDFEQTMDEA
ncbi:hypothetical protein [Exiguobacterium mexicanum]|uniref:hypothetical protein n=1 Tax=Exiguobacterium mexicanum TaxID=340146 RepID=UPI00110DD211|nr:hypothetical protein [Exiguobacterium mexicanum]